MAAKSINGKEKDTRQNKIKVNFHGKTMSREEKRQSQKPVFN